MHTTPVQTQARANQRARLLQLLKVSAPDWVPIREVIDVAGFQYSARVFELRRLGHRIENDPGRAFRLVTSLPVPEPLPQREPVSASETGSLFGDLALETRHRDDG